jgi:hypothetical protein
VEGSDPHATWSMIRSSFTQLACGTSAGDGILLLLPTEKNKAIIDLFGNRDADL